MQQFTIENTDVLTNLQILFASEIIFCYMISCTYNCERIYHLQSFYLLMLRQWNDETSFNRSNLSPLWL